MFKFCSRKTQLSVCEVEGAEWNRARATGSRNKVGGEKLVLAGRNGWEMP